MSSRPSDPGHAGQNEQEQPYEGKHRAPESKPKRLERSEADVILDQLAGAPHPMPDALGHTASEVRGD
jgi:hypothetical protein